MSAAVDHLVVGAASLEQGAAWCRHRFGVAAVAGGRHPHMGTHNLLLAIGSDAFPRSYLEIIAVDPQAQPPARPRWFGLDEPQVQRALQHEPQLLHLVARCTGLDAMLARLRALGVEPGAAAAAERVGAHGRLRWCISGRGDGSLPFGGALPTLIEWDGPHPAEHLPASGVTLTGLQLGGLPPALAAALNLPHVTLAPDGPALQASLRTPRGELRLARTAAAGSDA